MPHSRPWPSGLKLHERPATDADYDALFALHVDSMRDYVDRTWGWVDADQVRFFREAWPKNTGLRLLIESDKVVAAWRIERRAGDVFLAFVEVASSHQSRGIGTLIVERALAEAAAAGVAARLQVLKANPRAKHLYARLGFSVESETATHFLMVARASTHMRVVNRVRPGFHTITPYLTTQDAEGLVAFLVRGLGGVETYRGKGGSGGIHVEVRVGDSMVMVGASKKAQNAMLYLYVEDPDASYARAIGAGATSLWEPTDTADGERRCGVVDAFGNQWFFGRPKG